MRVEIKIPQLGESVNEGTISQVLKASGSFVQMDEEIIELETDKVNQVLTAPRAGQLQLLVNVEDTVVIGQVIGHVDTSVTEPQAPRAPAPQAQAPRAPAPQAQAPQAQAPQPQAPQVPAPQAPAPLAAPKGSVRRKEAEFLSDLEKPETPDVPPVKARETRSRMPKIRRVIAERLVEAQHSAAMLTTFNEVDLTEVIELRKRYKDQFLEKHGVKLGFMSWFVKACVVGLKEIPALNSYIDGEMVVHREYYDIGIAVGTERGLMVPVLRHCDQLSLAEIEAQIVEYAKQARKGTISVDALRGGGFTITNGGVYGSLLSTPILNPPQVGILGMHKIQERPMGVKGSVQLRSMMYLALSYDHRLVDGEGAVTFLVRVKELLEDPARFLLGL